VIPELGQLSLALAFCLCAVVGFFGLAGAAWQRTRWLDALGTMVTGQFVFVLVAFGALVQAFVADDFSVAYVANNSNSLLPWYYKVSAVWGAHEGSFLLWTLIMAGWMLAVALRGQHLPAAFAGRVLGVMGLLNLGFLAFLLWTSNPFERLVPMTPGEGADLNPLLQDFGLIVHPPMLYMGYVGFSVAFAFAVAALLTGLQHLGGSARQLNLLARCKQLVGTCQHETGNRIRITRRQMNSSNSNTALIRSYCQVAS